MNDIYDVRKILIISVGVLAMAIVMQVLYNYTFIRWALLLLIVCFGIVCRNRIIRMAKELLKKEEGE